MAATALSLAGKVLEVLGSSAYQQIVAAWGVDDEFNRLQDTLKAIKLVLIDAEEKQENNPKLRLWLEWLQDVLYRIQDVADDFEIQASIGKVSAFFSCSNPIAFRFRMSNKIDEIQKRLNEIDSDKNQFGLSERSEDGRHLERKRETHSFVDVSTIVGRDEDREKIIHILMHPSGVGCDSVIPIVGFGGLGKTTLAKLVYNDNRVVEHFELKMWVCVSYDFDLKSLIKEILKSANKVGFLGYDSLSLDQLQYELRRVLNARRFLLVLDDVWNENPIKWQELSQLLVGAEGSKVMVTTRSKLAAAIVNPDFRYDLNRLSHDDCLSLFLRWAHVQVEEAKRRNLVGIANEIVKRCGGNPLAAKTLGSLLSSTTNEKDWLYLKDSKMWTMEKRASAEDDIMHVLKLSYNHLPPHLKSCFAYCSIFPKDFKFNSLDLIQLWVANGFIQSDGSCEPEYLGMQYLKELWARGFFEDIQEHVFIYTFKMHDLMHDLAISVAGNDFLFVDSHTRDIAAEESIRHLSLFRREENIKLPDKFKKCRSLVCPITVLGALTDSNVGRFITGCKHLWMLDLSSSSFEELPSSIGLLKHLRYFSLSGNRRLRKLPASIRKLRKLQVLVLSGCKRLLLPLEEISQMISLRVLEMTGWFDYWIWFDFKSLNSLKVLSITGCQQLHSFSRPVENLPSLRTLGIMNCPELTYLVPVAHFPALENLLISNCRKLVWTPEGEEDGSEEHESIIQSVALTKLETLTALPSWLQRSANTLKQIIVEDCVNFTALPEWLENLKSLKKLVITGCPKLSSLPEGMNHLLALEELTLGGAPDLINKCQRGNGEDWPKIAHVPEIYVDNIKI